MTNYYATVFRRVYEKYFFYYYYIIGFVVIYFCGLNVGTIHRKTDVVAGQRDRH